MFTLKELEELTDVEMLHRVLQMRLVVLCSEGPTAKRLEQIVKRLRWGILQGLLGDTGRRFIVITMPGGNAEASGPHSMESIDIRRWGLALIGGYKCEGFDTPLEAIQFAEKYARDNGGKATIADGMPRA